MPTPGRPFREMFVTSKTSDIAQECRLVVFMSEHFKALMFDCHKQYAVAMVRQ
jgi:hypothetical protein